MRTGTIGTRSGVSDDVLELIYNAYLAGVRDGQAYPGAQESMVLKAADGYVKLVLENHGRRFSLDSEADKFFCEFQET